MLMSKTSVGLNCVAVLSSTVDQNIATDNNQKTTDSKIIYELPSDDDSDCMIIATSITTHLQDQPQPQESQKTSKKRKNRRKRKISSRSLSPDKSHSKRREPLSVGGSDPPPNNSDSESGPLTNVSGSGLADLQQQKQPQQSKKTSKRRKSRWDSKKRKSRWEPSHSLSPDGSRPKKSTPLIETSVGVSGLVDLQQQPQESQNTSRRKTRWDSSTVSSQSLSADGSHPLTPHHMTRPRSFNAISRNMDWPKPTNPDICHSRNRILTDYIRGRNWDMSNESRLLHTIITSPSSVYGWELYYAEFPLIYNVEWNCGSEGVGDLLCTDGHNRFLVVELKSIHSRRSYRRVKYGEAQAVKYARSWHKRNPQVIHTTGLFVCENYIRKMIELDRPPPDPADGRSSDDRSSDDRSSDPSNGTLNN